MAVKTTELSASLPLQALLYYNAIFSVVFGIFTTVMVIYKMTTFRIITQFLVLPPALTLAWLLVEIIRIRLGYSGNLRGKVPNLAAFLLVTFFPQLPIVAMLTFALPASLPVDIMMGAPLLLMMVVEIVLSYNAVRVLIARQTAQFFRFCQEDPGAEGDDDTESPRSPRDPLVQ